MTPEKRHSRWYEKLFFNIFFQIILMALVTLFLPAFLLWGKEGILQLTDVQRSSLLAVALVIIMIITSLRVLMKFPGNKSSRFIFSTVLSSYGIVMMSLAVLRVNYSFKLCLVSFVATLLFVFCGYLWSRRWVNPKIAYVPFGKISNKIEEISSFVRWIELTSPTLRGLRIDAIVVDLHSPELSDEWQKFLARCTLNGIPVYNYRQLKESLTGRVKIRHMYENDLGSLLPSPIYSFVKRLLDIALVLLSLPITLPIMIITAIAIKKESPGGIFFVQKRVGQGGKEFSIYKFRSMCQDSEKEGAKFAIDGDARVTRVGRFIRKTRIDELPQFINVLKGDMSLIGPRPEQKVFVDEFEKKIPFYAYRHIVKPGISGWAQVVHGYAENADETQIKIEHDFYYIKNFSFWLDLLIVFKTIGTMLTGFGAR